MESLAPFLVWGLTGLLVVLGIGVVILLGIRSYAAWRDRIRLDMRDTTRSKLLTAIQELADPNNNGLTWVVKPLKPKSQDETAVLKQVMTELSRVLSDEDRWRLAELYEGTGMQAEDMQILRDTKKPWYERARTAYRLGQMRCASAIETLTTALRDPSQEVRLMAIWALTEIGDDRAVSPIVVSLADANGWELMHAANCLLGMTGELTLPLLDLLRASGPKRERRERISATVLDLLSEFGQRARNRLNPRACRQAADDLLKSDSVDIRARAVRALTALGIESHDELEVILRCLKDPAWEVRAVTARALGEMQVLDAIPLLIQAVSDEAYWVRHNAAVALKQFGEFGYEALDHLQRSQDRFAREMARQVMDQI
ncbi:MAG: HEAT repeat domain-containing protein [Acidobacteria bacterium]|nr:HEAT repeat domain-containing protein [Acidobacteriota bacterium]